MTYTSVISLTRRAGFIQAFLQQPHAFKANRQSLGVKRLAVPHWHKVTRIAEAFPTPPFAGFRAECADLIACFHILTLHPVSPKVNPFFGREVAA